MSEFIPGVAIPPKFMVLSRGAIESMVDSGFDEPHGFISIRTPRDPEEVRLPVNDHTCGALHLVFHDLDTVTMPPDVRDAILADEPRLEAELFTSAMARAIISFVTRLVADRVSLFVVHCDAGLSRSPGVAAALDKCLGSGDDSEWFKRYLPNRLVYRTILEAFHAGDVVRAD